jgi:CelD/BcsL family acetyltransferase involved in cellulose biosynthesis
MGIGLLDLGKGDDAYKQNFASLELLLTEGCVARPSVAAATRRLRFRSESILRATRLADPIRPILRRVKRWMRERSYD